MRRLKQRNLTEEPLEITAPCNWQMVKLQPSCGQQFDIVRSFNTGD